MAHERRSEVIEIVNLFRAKVVDVAVDSIVIELAGTEDKIEAFVELMTPYGILELARTGVIAMKRGMQLPRATGDKGEAKRRVRSLDAGPAEALPPS